MYYLDKSSASTGDLSTATFTCKFMKSLIGPGISSGGTAGQVLVKKSDTDYDFEWQTLT